MPLAQVYKEPPRYELHNGDIVMMASSSYRHNNVQGNLCMVLRKVVKQGGHRCKVGLNTDVFLTKDDNFIPDVYISCDRSLHKGGKVHGAPDLVVEVLSSSTEGRDRGYKKDIYGQCGVKEYWLVDINEQTVEVYLQDNGNLNFTNKHYLSNKDSFAVSFLDGSVVDLDEVFKDNWRGE